MTTSWLQYTHLDKLYGYLPGMTDALPAVFGLTAAEYESVRAGFAARAESAARDLLADAAFAARVDGLPFAAGETVLAVGDSVTDDLQSWAEILRYLLEQRRPELGVRVVNGGLSAHTTTMVLRRWPATVAGTKPDWVLCALGGNDVTRVGPEPTVPQVGPTASVANLARMRAIAPAASWVWLTPVPVHEDRVAGFPAFRFGGSTWRNDDIGALATAMRELDGPLVDLVATFGMPADPGLQGEDGVHPTLAGQTAIARTLVETLTGRAGRRDV
ncbi:SGNH/GDSL hydrolase family protein [Actinophytocola sp.]|uniref:SGNH/GDSL hydrolase family protein n=1 Tax=Actinophytocola sp. TaxID=1872138 RepID=UPI002EDAC841